MSWSGSTFGFGQTTSNTPAQTISYDLQIQKNLPGVILNGTEAGAIYTEVREVGGDLWIVQNASYNGTSWIPQVLTLPVFATRYGAPGGANSGYMTRFSCAAGVNPCVFTAIWQMDGSGNITTQGSTKPAQSGTVASMRVDGSTNTVTYTAQSGFSFATTTDQVVISLSNLSNTSDLPGAPIVLSKTASGFTFLVPGGNSGDTATIDYYALGH